MRVSTVYACANLLADTLATAPCRLYRRDSSGDRMRQDGHPADTAIHVAPNSTMTAYDYKRQMMLNLAVTGNHYSQIARGVDRINLYPLTSKYVSVKNASGNVIYTYDNPATGTKANLSASDVVHNRLLSMDGITGIGPIEQCRRTIYLAQKQEEHGVKQMDNGGRAGALLVHPGRLSADARANLRKSVTEQTTGSNSYSLLVLEEGMKYEQMALSNEDLQFLDGRKFTRSEICAIFRVPPHMICDLDKATFSNIEHLFTEFVNITMLPWTVAIEQRLNASLLTDSERKAGFYFKFGFNHLLRGDTATRFSTYQIGLLNGIYSPNEIRAKEELSPRPGGDEYRVPANTLPSGE